MENYTVISSAADLCGECPMWDPEKKVLLWSDMLAGILFKYDPADGSKTEIAHGKNVSGFALNGKNGLICATHQGIFLWEGVTGYRLLAESFEGEHLGCNDAIADPRGRFLFGTTYYNPESCITGYKLGKLFKVEKDGALSVLDDGLHLSNGFGFSPDNKTMYLTDTVTRLIYAYDYDAEKGAISNKRIFVKVPDTEGIPDGMTVDAAGYVWSAQWYGSRVVRYDPDGKVERVIKTPMMQTSSVMFGGDDYTDLYVTTAAKSVRLSCAPKGYDFDGDNIGGPLYRYNFGIPGRPEFISDVHI